jgi:hypothetical protein
MLLAGFVASGCYPLMQRLNELDRLDGLKFRIAPELCEGTGGDLRGRVQRSGLQFEYFQMRISRILRNTSVASSDSSITIQGHLNPGDLYLHNSPHCAPQSIL